MKGIYDMKRKVLKCIVKIVAFVTIFAVLLSGVTLVLCNQVDRMSYDPIRGFYDEPKNSLDAVYIGSSNTLDFWNPLAAWEEYGIAVYSFASNAQPLASAEFMIKEARKTQPNAKFIINVNTLSETDDPAGLYRIFDYTPTSLNKMIHINKICDMYNLSVSDKLEYYFPIISFHDRWSRLKKRDFKVIPNDYKGSVSAKKYLFDIVDISNRYNLEVTKSDISPMLKDAMNSLLDYCDKEKVEVLFVTVPQSKSSEELGKYNAINELVSKRGYPTLNLIDKTEEVGIFTHKDFFNRAHTNIHGSLKYTYYLSEYLIENYGFVNKRGEDEYSSWDEQWEEYLKSINCSILDFQLDSRYDCKSIEAPAKVKAVFNDGSIKVSWKESKGAEGYAVYKKEGKTGAWHKVKETTELSFIDKDYTKGIKQFYRIAPYKVSEDNTWYGDFSYFGASVVVK